MMRPADYAGLATLLVLALYVRKHGQKITNLEVAMSETDDKVSRLDEETTATGRRFTALVTQVRQLTDRLAELEPDAAEVEQVKADLAKALGAMERNSNYLHQLGADPENPIPDTSPDPTEGLPGDESLPNFPGSGEVVDGGPDLLDPDAEETS